MKRLSWKAINAWIMFGLLLAPGLYLFGGYIGQLAGSHGEFMYAEPPIEGGVDYSVQYNGITYQRYMYTNSFLDEYNGFDSGGDEFNIGFDENNHEQVIINPNFFNNVENVYAGYPYYGFTQYVYDSDNQLYLNRLPQNSCFSYWRYDQGSDTRLHYYEVYYTTHMKVLDWTFYSPEDDDTYIELDFNDESEDIYLYDWDVISFKNESYWALELTFTTPRNIPEVQPNIQSAQAIEPNAQGNTEFQQGQFFSRNNFLKKWGDSVVSQDETWGFAPFKALIQYLDDNMLHFAPNGVQYGLMAYGYMYYALHIVLLDLVFYITSFLPRILKKLAERLEGGLD